MCLSGRFIILVLLFVPGAWSGLFAGSWDQIARIQGLFRVMDLKEGMHDERFRLLHEGNADTMTCRELRRTFDLPVDITGKTDWYLWVYACPIRAKVLINDVFVGRLESDTGGVVIGIPGGILEPFRNTIQLIPEQVFEAGCLTECFLLSSSGNPLENRLLHTLYIGNTDTAMVIDQATDTVSLRRYLNEVKTAGVSTVYCTAPPTISMMDLLESCGYRLSLTFPEVAVSRFRGTDSISWYDRNGNRTPSWGRFFRTLPSGKSSQRVGEYERLITYGVLLLFGICMVMVRYTVPRVFSPAGNWIMGLSSFLQEARKGSFLKPLFAVELLAIQVSLEILTLPMVWMACGWSGSSGLFSVLSFPSMFSSWCVEGAGMYHQLPEALMMTLGWLVYRAFWFTSFAWISGVSGRTHLFVQAEVLTGFYTGVASAFIAILLMVVPDAYVIPLIYVWVGFFLIRQFHRIAAQWMFSGQGLAFRGFVRILYICVLEFLPVLILF